MSATQVQPQALLHSYSSSLRSLQWTSGRENTAPGAGITAVDRAQADSIGTMHYAGPVFSLGVPMQAKLAIGQPRDVNEREADAVADQVMRMPEPWLQRCSCGGSAESDGECAECRNQRLSRQRNAEDHAETTAVPPIAHEVLRSPGRQLDPTTQAYMEPRYGHDFSQVHVHTDEKAAQSARAVNARAYTVGRDVVFGASQFAPETRDGQRLLAHELAHVVQQQEVSATPGTLLRKPQDGGAKGADTPPSTFTLLGANQTWFVLEGFATKKWDLADSHADIIERVVKDLKERPLEFGGFVTVVGYADNVPSTDPGNKALGQLRADTVRDALVKRGIPEGQVHAYSLGDEMPAVKTAAPQARNRRVTITITRPPMPRFFRPEPIAEPGKEVPQKQPAGVGFDILRPGLCVIYPSLCRAETPPETPEEAGRRIFRPIPKLSAANPDALDEIARWATQDVPIPDWLVNIARRFGVENARKKLREALQKGGRAALEKALKEIVEAVAGPPTTSLPEGSRFQEISPPTILKLPPVSF